MNIKLKSTLLQHAKIKRCSRIPRDCVLSKVSDLSSVVSLTEQGIEMGPHHVKSRDRDGFLMSDLHDAGKCLH